MMDSFIKRRNEEDLQLFSTSKATKLEDHLSQLPDDCLLDILPRLDQLVTFSSYIQLITIVWTHLDPVHSQYSDESNIYSAVVLLRNITDTCSNDLDELSTLSEKLKILSDLSRTRATKVFANEIRIIQITNKQFFITMSTEKRIFFVDNSNQYDISERMKPCNTRYELPLSDDRPQTQIISEIVANRIIALANRFDFERNIFEGVSIDNHFVRCIEHLSTSRFLRNFGANECVVDAKLSPEGRTRFLSTLLAIKAAHIFLWCDSICIDDVFMREYADTVPFADFYCHDDDSEIIEPDENLWKFKTLGMGHMVIEVHWIFHQIWKRLHQKKEGEWWFSLTRQLTLDDIMNNLPAEVQNVFILPDRGEDTFVIEIVGTIHKAIFSPIYDPIQIRPEWTLKVKFT